MFEFKTIVTQPINLLIYKMPCSLQRQQYLTSNRLRHKKKQTTKLAKKKIKFTAKTEYVNLKAHSNNFEMQSDKILTTQKYVLLNILKMESFLNVTM